MQIAIMLNGERREAPLGTTVAALVESLALAKGRVAVERNREIVPMSQWADVALADGDSLEIVHFVGGGQDDDTWSVAGRTFSSRLIVGTGKYRDYAQNAAAAAASGAEIVTMSPYLCVKPPPGASRSLIGANMVPR